jgi:large subunit ribosomal protein L7/L12
MPEMNEVVEFLGNMTILECISLTKELEKLWGVSSAPQIQQVKPKEVVEVVEEKTEFDVILKDSGPTRINVIKAVREITGLGLKEAKELVESIPKPIREGVSKDEANQIAEKIKAAGGTVEIK